MSHELVLYNHMSHARISLYNTMSHELLYNHMSHKQLYDTRADVCQTSLHTAFENAAALAPQPPRESIEVMGL